MEKWSIFRHEMGESRHEMGESRHEIGEPRCEKRAKCASLLPNV